MHPLFERFIDFAGVFPPASLSVIDATAQYRQAAESSDGWIMGPMLLRASQLDEYQGGDAIGIVADAAAVGEFAQVEKATAPDAVRSAIGDLLGVAPIVYIESADPADLAFLDEIATHRSQGRDVRAKIRTGGATAESFPTPERVAAFIRSCAERSLPFKATAGLHHPVRTPSTVAGAMEHGFINMLAAVRCALSDPDAMESCLSETDSSAFDMKTATWRGIGVGITAEEIRSLFASVGSCSFDEPTGYLRDLGVI